MSDYDALLQYNKKVIKVANEGFLGLYNGSAVDMREFPDAEPFSSQAVNKIVTNLTKENENIRQYL